ncbi:MAG: hypothetical protein MR051_03355 [Lentisphaeria bacterium]|nr:hypothetical protein [Lentisphaeria bacterium]
MAKVRTPGPYKKAHSEPQTGRIRNGPNFVAYNLARKGDFFHFFLLKNAFLFKSQYFLPIFTGSRYFRERKSDVPEEFSGTSLPAGGVGLRRLQRFAHVSPHFKRRPAFRRWTTSGQRPEEDFFFLLLFF